MRHADVNIKVEDAPRIRELLDAAGELAAGVESFLSSLPYAAPEIIPFHAEAKLAEPLAEFRAAVAGDQSEAPTTSFPAAGTSGNDGEEQRGNN